MRRSLYLILILLCSIASQSAHLVGGEISYRCLGNNNYEVKLVIYRDCQSNGAPFDDPAIITIYDGSKNFIDNLYPSLHSARVLPITAPNSCTTLPSFVCTAEGVYLDTVNLAPNSSGYTFSHQRCCRNASIDNVPNPSIWGNTYTIEVPANANCNSSPSFVNPPPVALCLNIATDIDMSVLETDGDSLTYSLCYPLHGGGNQTTVTGPNSPRPDTATPPPYQIVPFSGGFSAGQPIPGNPAFSLNPNTGILSGTPSQIGQYVFAICVQEWRNGQLLSTLRRDFQFNVTNQCRGTASNFMPQTTDPYLLCQGKTVKFNELTFNASSYLWDFGVANSMTDTSTQANPTFTFPDTGSYVITLIANPGSACADTFQRVFQIYDGLSLSFQVDGQACFDSHFFNFQPQGTYSDSAQFFWDFGGMTNRGSSTSSEAAPQNVIYNQSGAYLVRLEVQDGPCRDLYEDSVRLFRRPELLHDLSGRNGCMPLKLEFKDSSEYDGGQLLHFWDFGDGNTSIQEDPQHIYTSPGSYYVSHRIISASGCKDTLYERSNTPIQVFPKPEAKFAVSPLETDIFHPDFQISVEPIPSEQSGFLILPNGRRLTPRVTEFVYTARDTGVQNFIQIIENEYGCLDTLIISTYVRQPFRLYVPNAFSPNDDGLNDEFSYSLLGVKEFEINIFNRWGQLIFNTDNPQLFWNGRMQNNGKVLPGGTYSYQIGVKIRETGESYYKRGVVNLIR